MQKLAIAKIAGGVIATALVAVVISAAIVPKDAIRHVHLELSYRSGTIAELVERADALAIVEISGNATSHWNAADNREWGRLGRDSFIYSDVPVRVITAFAGNLPPSLTIRDLGGIADGVELSLGRAVRWRDGGQFLLFLEHREFPTKEGTDSSWTPVRLAEGVFAWSGAGWFEAIQGHLISDAEIPALAAHIDS